MTIALTEDFQLSHSCGKASIGVCYCPATHVAHDLVRLMLEAFAFSFLGYLMYDALIASKSIS